MALRSGWVLDASCEVPSAGLDNSQHSASRQDLYGSEFEENLMWLTDVSPRFHVLPSGDYVCMCVRERDRQTWLSRPAVSRQLAEQGLLVAPSLQSRGPPHASLPCPSSSPGVRADSCPPSRGWFRIESEVALNGARWSRKPHTFPPN